MQDRYFQEHLEKQTHVYDLEITDLMADMIDSKIIKV
jgi:hypothetical protein